MKRAVITGLGIASPFGMGWRTWVDGLRNGASATRHITLFDARRPLSREGSTASALPCRVAAEVPDFCPQDWMSERELARVPRVVPIALAAAHEAITTSCLTKVLDGERQDVHVVIGSGGGGFSFAEEQLQHWFNRDLHSLSPYAISSSIAGMISSEISIHFGLRGRSHTLSNGCTSSTDALGTALDLIRSGRARTVITGGADAPITPATIAAFCLMKAVPTKFNDAPSRAARPFDRDRDGFVLGEGAWIFVVEEEEHALARGAKLWAEIAGYGSTCEAYHRVALSQPDEAARAMHDALADAELASDAVDYVNLHGTGTQLNDPLETAAVKMTLGPRAHQIPMSSTKSQIGHPQGASGAAGIAAALAAMHEDFVPPTINLDNPDERCDLDYVANHARSADIEIALCNCLGFGSKNSALVLRRL